MQPREGKRIAVEFITRHVLQDGVPMRLAVLRDEMAAALTGLGLDVIDGSAPFVVFAVPDATLMRKHLHANRIAVRRCDTFVGMGTDYLRATVRDEWPVLIEALSEGLR